MIDLDTIINTCYATTSASRQIAFYSHLIPVILSILLGTLVFFKSKRTLFSKTFLAFVSVFSLWLIGDLILWTQNNYFLVYASWAPLDYIEIIFFILALDFAIVFVQRSTMSALAKISLFVLTLPALFITLSLQSVAGFNYPVCEAFNNDLLGTYKLAVEAFVLIVILIYMLIPFIKKESWEHKKASLIVLGSTFLFLSIFAVTEYLASVTGYYEMNLYSLFLLPIFLVAIIYSVFELDIFNVRILGTHYLVVGLIILMGGQLFFITSTTNKLLTILAIVIAAGLSVILFRNLKRESDQRVQIENLNTELKVLFKQRESLVHLVTHKIKGSFTRSKYIFAGLLDGTFGEINEEVKKRAKQGLDSDDAGIDTVDLVLNADNLQKGAVKYDMQTVDFKKMVLDVIEEKRISIEAKGLQIEKYIKPARNASGQPAVDTAFLAGIADAGGDDTYNVLGDAFWLKEAVNNLIENSIKYTRNGKITIDMQKVGGKILFSVKDTGIGITEEDKKNLFTEGGRGKNSVKVNIDSTGYGLYSVKLIIDAHKGHVWAESEGVDKGSTFFMELDTI